MGESYVSRWVGGGGFTFRGCLLGRSALNPQELCWVVLAWGGVPLTPSSSAGWCWSGEECP